MHSRMPTPSTRPGRGDHVLGYFQGRENTIFTCLSHDVISHETTHALLDGLRERYMKIFSPPIRLPSTRVLPTWLRFSRYLPCPVSLSGSLISARIGKKEQPGPPRRILISRLTEERLFHGLLALGEQMGEENPGDTWLGRRCADRGKIKPSPQWYRDDLEFKESHRRGEILVAAVLHAFVSAWRHRLVGMGAESASLDGGKTLDRERVVEEGATLAATLLTSAIRALDYAPTVDLKFGDYLSAILTGDREVRPDDKKYELRQRLREAFVRYGVQPSNDATTDGTWPHAPQLLRYSGVHLSPRSSMIPMKYFDSCGITEMSWV